MFVFETIRGAGKDGAAWDLETSFEGGRNRRLDGGFVELLSPGTMSGLSIKDPWFGACGQATIEAIVGEVVHIGGDGNKLGAWNDARSFLDILSDVSLDDGVDGGGIWTVLHDR